MTEWVKDNGARTSPVFKDIEVFKNLPPSWAKAALGETSTTQNPLPVETLVGS